jgi:hypothetical protein
LLIYWCVGISSPVLPCRYPRHHSTFPPSQVMCFTSCHVSAPRQAIGHACTSPQLSFPSARNAHQRTVGALSILYHRALLRFSDSGKHSFAYQPECLCCHPQQAIGQRQHASRESHKRWPSYLPCRLISRALKQMPSQPAFRVLTRFNYGSRWLCTDGLQTT